MTRRTEGTTVDGVGDRSLHSRAARPCLPPRPTESTRHGTGLGEVYPVIGDEER
jgi:hypothetical protein